MLRPSLAATTRTSAEPRPAADAGDGGDRAGGGRTGARAAGARGGPRRQAARVGRQGRRG